MVSTLPIIPFQLPLGYCYPSEPQTLLNDFARSTVQFTGDFTVILATNSTPAATQRTSLWYKPSDGRTYYYDLGMSSWVMIHPYAPASGARLWWEDTTTALQTFDGGDTGSPGLQSGPMWEVDANYAGKFPLGVGTLQPSATVVALSGTGGADQVALTQANLPAVKILVNTAIIGHPATGSPEPVVGSTYGSTPIAGAGRAVDGTSTDLTGRGYTKGQTDDLGTGAVVSTVPPFRAGYWVKRTTRTHYKGA